MRFEERLLEIRKSCGMSQEALAEKVGVSRQAVSKWETGEAQPDYTKLIALADALEVSLDYLCGREPRVENIPTTVTENPEKKQKVWVTLVAIIAVLIVGVVGLFAGWQIANREQGPVEPAAPQLPDEFSVTGVEFTCNQNGLYYKFVPSVSGEQFVYQICFISSDGEKTVYDIENSTGGCAGKTDLQSGSGYTVVAVVSNGEESRMVTIATGLSFGDGRASWHPEQ